MLIQLPVFLAFYWVLLESVEMRQAPFIGWIQDLVVARSAVHPAGDHGRCDVPAVQAAAARLPIRCRPRCS